MLKFQPNIYGTFEDLKSAMGTNPDPFWMIIYDTNTLHYSAIDLTDKDMVIDYAVRNNIKGLCVVNPADLMMVMKHEQPHLICQAIHEWITLHTPHPYEIELKQFTINLHEHNTGSNEDVIDVSDDLNPSPDKADLSPTPKSCSDSPINKDDLDGLAGDQTADAVPPLVGNEEKEGE